MVVDVPCEVEASSTEKEAGSTWETMWGVLSALNPCEWSTPFSGAKSQIPSLAIAAGGSQGYIRPWRAAAVWLDNIGLDMPMIWLSIKQLLLSQCQCSVIVHFRSKFACLTQLVRLLLTLLFRAHVFIFQPTNLSFWCSHKIRGGGWWLSIVVAFTFCDQFWYGK